MLILESLPKEYIIKCIYINTKKYTKINKKYTNNINTMKNNLYGNNVDLSNIYSLHMMQDATNIFTITIVFHKITSWQNHLLRRSGKKHRRAK